MKNPPPLVLFMTAACLQRLLTRGAPSSPALRGASLVIGTSAAAVLIAPVIEFRIQGTTVDPRGHAAPSSLVTDGVNAHTRNPMYLGMAGLLLANAVHRPAPQAFLPLLAFAAWIDRRQIPSEETALHSQFDDDYAQYRSQVPRWISLPSKKRDAT